MSVYVAFPMTKATRLGGAAAEACEPTKTISAQIPHLRSPNIPSLPKWEWYSQRRPATSRLERPTSLSVELPGKIYLRSMHDAQVIGRCKPVQLGESKHAIPRKERGVRTESHGIAKVG